MNETERAVLDCLVCYSKFSSDTRVPLSIDCGHTLCVVCLEQLISCADSFFKCPFCKQQIPTRPLEEYPRNYILFPFIQAS